MISGTCSAAKLAQICSTPISARIVYLRVDRRQADLQRISLQMPGTAWQPTLVGMAAVRSEPGAERVAGVASALSALRLPWRISLPLLMRQLALLPPDDPTGCSALGGCGWFTSDGRMVDYIHAP